MNKKLLVAFLATISTFALAFGLSACGEKPHEHIYETTVTAPACTEQGYTTHTCSCGDSYVDSYVNALGHNFTNYVSDGNATYEKDGTKTAICDREGCNETDTITDEGSKLKSGISFKTLSVTGTDAYGKVSNTTETFSFINEVTALGTAKYVVALDIYGSQQVATKTIPLSIGENTVYIIETIDGEPINVYTVTVRRRHMYEVTFNTSGGSTVESQTVEEDSLASQPTTTRTGYTFSYWDYDFATPITQDTEITAIWTANTNTPYTVEYYLQNLADENYTLETTENKTGTTDTTATAEIKTFEHFTAEKQTVSGNINGDGSTVLKVYYTRDTYTVTFDGNGGTLVSGSESQTVKYGGSVTAPEYVKTGYTFNFDKTNFTNISESFTVTALWTINQYTLTIVYGNGQENKVITQNYNTPIESIANPESRAGYDFIGWDKTIPTSMPAENLIVTAKWNAIFTLSEGTVTGLTSYGKNNYTKLNIPSKIDGVTVTSIGDSAFSGCSSLTEINYNATECSDFSFGNYVFYNAGRNGTGITVTIGANVKKISAYLFYPYSSSYSPKIISVVFAEGSVCESIGDYAFYNCSSLTSVTIPDGVTSIGDRAFYNCSSLTSVYITDIAAWCKISFGSYDANPLYYAHNLYLNNELVTELTIPNSVTSIGSSAFYNCSSLTSITIPDSVTSIGSWAFIGCYKLIEVKNLSRLGITAGSSSYGYVGYYAKRVYTEGESYLSTDDNGYIIYDDGTDKILMGYTGTETDLTLPSGITQIYKYAFSYCSSLTSVTIGNSVTSIGYEAFYGCSSLTSVTIGNSVTSIASYAFYNCSSLTSVTIPDSVTRIGEDAFKDCRSLTSITFSDTSTWYRTTNYTDWQNKSGGTQTSVTNSSQNATYFKSTYYNYYWYKL